LIISFYRLAPFSSPPAFDIIDDSRHYAIISRRLAISIISLARIAHAARRHAFAFCITFAARLRHAAPISRARRDASPDA